MVSSDESLKLLTEQAASGLAEQGDLGFIAARWQREWLEAQGWAHDDAMHAVWAIGQEVQPDEVVAGKAGAPAPPAADSNNELLQAFGKLQIGVERLQSSAYVSRSQFTFCISARFTYDGGHFSNRYVNATKPATKPLAERRYAPAKELQRGGELSREKALEFLSRCADELMSDELIASLRGVVATSGPSAVGQLCISCDGGRF